MSPSRSTSISWAPIAIDGGAALLRRRRRVRFGGRAAAASLLLAAGAWSISAATDPPREAVAPAPTLADPEDIALAYRRPPSQWPPAWIDPGVAFTELGVPPAAPGLTVRQRAQAALGEALFSDPLLSSTGRVACASCHDPGQAWSTSRPTSVGVHGQRGRRNPPDLRQALAHRRWGWDGRGDTPEAQSLAPLTDPGEMGHRDVGAVLDRLASQTGYVRAFAELYGPGPLTATALGEVLAAHVMAIAADPPRSRFARFMEGRIDALSTRELQGLHLFRTRARCANCHAGPGLSDGQFHNLLISSFGEPAEDLGRLAVTGLPAETGAFRTPSLHRVSASAPYMHSGLFPDLEGVIRFYRRGGGEVWARNAAEAAHPLHRYAARPSDRLKPLDLTEDEIAALAAFLRAL